MAKEKRTDVHGQMESGEARESRAFKGRTLKALGYSDVASQDPLVYPGRPTKEPALLKGDLLLPLTVQNSQVGDWLLGDGDSIDDVLQGLGLARMGQRFPVIAVGSNASPGQMSYKLRQLHTLPVLPMVPARVRGIRVGVSGHISPAGYVAAAPYVDHSAVSTLIVTWFDQSQLRAVDETEFPEYRRVLINGTNFPIVLPSGESLRGAYLYVNARGVLKDDSGYPRELQEQRSLLKELLEKSPRIRALLGSSPEEWVRRASSDRKIREEGTHIFSTEGWVLSQDSFQNQDDKLLTYDELRDLLG